MDKTLKSGLIAGIAGFLLMIVAVVIFFSDWLRFGNSPMAILSMMGAFALAFLVAGSLAGILALPAVRTAWGSFLPGLIAGFIATSIPLLGLLIFALIGLFGGLYRGGSGDYVWQTLLLILLVVIGIGLAGLCSAMTAAIIFFWREFRRPATKPEKEGDLESLGTLYGELWEDARTLVADMNQSIAVYRIAGLFMLVSGIVLSAFAVAGWLRALAGDYTSYEFLFTIAATICSPAGLIIGPYLLVWHDRLRKRYARLSRMEKTIGD